MYSISQFDENKFIYLTVPSLMLIYMPLSANGPVYLAYINLTLQPHAPKKRSQDIIIASKIISFMCKIFPFDKEVSTEK
jgi:hypothetical protein